MSVSSFDFGHVAEAARIANAIFILLGPRSRTHTSVVEALNWDIEMPTTVPSGNLMSVECIPVEAVGDRPASWFIQALPAGREAAVFRKDVRLSINEWWNEVVLKGSEGTLSRLDIIRITRDRDGGAHLDETISSPAYKAVLLRGAGFSYQPSQDAPSQPVENSIEAIIRQIANEVLIPLQSKGLAAQWEMQQLAAIGSTALFTEE
ncbi:hypothetical protein KMZ29_14380 [Bradyrhizobium sediminis]|uniref:Uncharacterized protein n=1 Tax=Bradyrhizobium sediminis TaxID=2840469 RepID=A0A975NA04_9BRAD|nr:hypothetical protein [Bradyrhizobium sediminis]QWG10970.1 hypothetical protein KMZ29_14380 [Bradyrhizobium sediminis]